LDRLVSGESPRQLRIAIPPTHVIARQSTETTAVEDPDVAGALIWVRDHLAQDISVDEVVEATGTCRRTLERRFRAAVGDSILDKIRRMRIEKAKHLLAETDLKLSVIAQQCGVGSAARLTVLFKQVTGYQPSLFRRAAGNRANHHAESPVPC
jgi:LacI family transcriptional regulator